ncbi:hypothetical protein GQ53DRAFT_705552 [Thozetella sp. PMI_491]|nr:hypothetical protein GQ53DRAFT_705552 [Thozetella sp. PMI_491]
MCTYYWLHSHHTPPCTRPIETELRYAYCNQAVFDPVTGQTTPCSNEVSDDVDGYFDFENPCSSGSCLPSGKCSSGGCRLEDLNGQWTCCRCKRGGNKYTSCRHRMRSAPDTFCYHVCCLECKADPSPSGQR